MMNRKEMKQVNGGMCYDMSCTNFAENNAESGQGNLALKLGAEANFATEAKLAIGNEFTLNSQLDPDFNYNFK